MEPEGSFSNSQVPATYRYSSQINPVHAPTSNFLKTHLNIILLFMPVSSQRSHSLKFLHQNLVDSFPRPHLIPLDSCKWKLTF